jgi:glyoxylase-like metal-dependent hydrolase (beta-lactamase superfamily II)
MFLICILSLVGALDPNVPYYFGIGDVQGWRIQDNSKTITLQSLFPYLTSSNFTGLVDYAGTPYLDATGNFRAPLSFSGTLLFSEGKWILVDDGLGALIPSAQPTRIPQLIQTIGIDLTSINYVLLTHFHTDHTGWDVNGLQTNAIEFPNAQYIAQIDEINYWSSTPALQNSSNYQNLIQPVINAGLLLGVQGIHSITSEVMVMPCKGHTPGHQCVIIDSNGQSAIIVGDAMHQPVQVQRPDWNSVYDWNMNYSQPLRQQLVTMIGATDMTLIASHFTYPGMGNVAKELNPLPSSSGWIYLPITV